MQKIFSYLSYFLGTFIGLLIIFGIPGAGGLVAGLITAVIVHEGLRWKASAAVGLGLTVFVLVTAVNWYLWHLAGRA